MGSFVEQVGGFHYQANYQHWDWVDDTQMPYLEGCATKYVFRWRQKGGVQDLEKALSYLVKRTRTPYSLPAGLQRSPVPELRERFFTSAMVGPREREVIKAIDEWTIGEEPLVLLQLLIEDARRGSA